jgi:hypothetical protein
MRVSKGIGRPIASFIFCPEMQVIFLGKAIMARFILR